jgi:hypothetical protein
MRLGRLGPRAHSRQISILEIRGLSEVLECQPCRPYRDFSRRESLSRRAGCIPTSESPVVRDMAAIEFSKPTSR